MSDKSGFSAAAAAQRDNELFDFLESELNSARAPMALAQEVLPPISDLTMLDLFCGSGGSSLGARRMGINVVHAANHSEIAIKTHELSNPFTDHSRADITDSEPSMFPATDILWASPECTNHSLAKGVRRRTAQGELGGTGINDIPAERSRVMMNDVPRFMQYARLPHKQKDGTVRPAHPYKYIVVENVVDVVTWEGFEAWTRDIRNLGYNYQIVSMNTAFAHSENSFGTPQSRDRVFIVCWDKKMPAPDLDFRPAAYCHECDDVVGGVQTFKRGRSVGKYKQQYVYKCERTGCNADVEPFAMPIASVLDFSLKAPLIGDRKRPLADKTMARIRGGLAQHGASIIAQVGGSTYERRPGVRTRPITEPGVTQTATQSGALVQVPGASMVVPVHGREGGAVARSTDGLGYGQTTRAEIGVVEISRPIIPAQLVPSGGTWREEATSVEYPAPTRTTSETDGVLLPPRRPGQALQITLRGGGSQGRGSLADDPSGTMSAGGINTGIVLPDKRPETYYTEKVRYRLPNGKFAELQIPPSWLDQYNNGGGLIDTMKPANTVTTLDRFGLVVGQAKWKEHVKKLKAAGVELEVTDELVNASGYRMMYPFEAGASQGFPLDYPMLGTHRQQVHMHGNAVPPPAAALLLGAIVQAMYPELAVDQRMRVTQSLATV